MDKSVSLNSPRLTASPDRNLQHSPEETVDERIKEVVRRALTSYRSILPRHVAALAKPLSLRE